MSSYLARAKAALRSSDPKVIAAVKAANAGILNIKLLTPGAVHNNSTLSNLSVQYANEAFIGTRLMPVLTVSELSNIYFKMGKNDRRAIPNAEVGTRSSPNETNETRSTGTYSCQPYALMNFVSDLTIKNQDAPLDEMMDSVASVNDDIDFNTEKKIATLLPTTGNHAASNTVTNSGASQWNSSTGGNPILDIQTAIDACEMGTGATKLLGFCGTEVARTLQRHPAMLDLFKYNGQGLVPMTQIAQWFGLDDILVGKARENTANEGQTAVSARLWGKHFGIVRVAETPGKRVACFGFTFRMGDKVTSQWYDPKPGMSGGYYNKVGVAEDYKVVANDTGYLISAAVA